VLLLDDLALPLVLHASRLVEGSVVVLVRGSQGTQLLLCQVGVLASLRRKTRTSNTAS
jgi:hypothetical protein